MAIINGTSAGDLLVGGSNPDLISGRAGNDTLRGDMGPDTLFGEDDNDSLWGGSGADSMSGGAGDDTLDARNDGLGFADTMDGGDGNDSYFYDDTRDKIVERSDFLSGIDTVYAGVSISLATLSANLEVAIANPASGTTAINLTGNALGNTLIGNAGANKLMGGVGNDTLHGGLGRDTLWGESDADVLLGGDGNDSLDGGSGDDRLEGGVGIDTLVGGDGSDTYVVTNNEDTIIDISGFGDLVESSASYSIANQANIEHLNLTGSALTGTGNEGANYIRGNGMANSLIGNGGNDTLDGAAGADNMTGGAGDDTYYIDNASDVVVEANDSTKGLADRIITALSIDLSTTANAAGIEHIELTGVNLSAKGNSLANRITGAGGNDLLDGFTGADTLVGGLGNDTYMVNSADDVVVEAIGQGTLDTVKTTISYDLGLVRSGDERSGIENLTATSHTGLTLTGNAAANKVFGAEGNDTLDGRSSSAGTGDSLYGGLGSDTYFVNSDLDRVYDLTVGNGWDKIFSKASMDMSLDASYQGIEEAELTGAAALSLKGNDYGQMLLGNGANNRLTGGLGHDTLVGGGGADTLVGGSGSDTYVLDNIEDRVFDIGGSLEDVNRIFSTFNVDLSLDAGYSEIDDVTLEGSANANVIGNDLDNVLEGNAGLNGIEGGLGNDTLKNVGAGDTLSGGLGDDTYIISDVNTTIVELAGDDNGYFDTIETTVSIDLDATTTTTGVEHFIVRGTDAVLIYANELDNTVFGNDAANELDGNGGNDTVWGEGGNDILWDSIGDDVLFGGQGSDRIGTTFSGGSPFTGFNVFYGDEGNDILRGSAGLDEIHGGADNDSINGYGNNDQLFGDDGQDSIRGGSGHDELYGGQGDDALFGDADHDYLSGGEGHDTLLGGEGNDTLTSDSGNDVLNGEAGNDTYLFAGYFGNDTISDADTAPGNTDSLYFEAEPASQLLFTKTAGGDLVITSVITDGNNIIADLGNKVTITGWSASTANQIEKIYADGGTRSLTSANVDALVSAMSAFAPAVGQAWEGGSQPLPQWTIAAQ